jgi:hypothetical protein
MVQYLHFRILEFPLILVFGRVIVASHSNPFGKIRFARCTSPRIWICMRELHFKINLGMTYRAHPFKYHGIFVNLMQHRKGWTLPVWGPASLFELSDVPTDFVTRVVNKKFFSKHEQTPKKNGWKTWTNTVSHLKSHGSFPYVAWICLGWNQWSLRQQKRPKKNIR